MAQRKKIVAIMFTGLANYSQLVKKDKGLALEILSEHDKILTEIINNNYGTIIKHINESIFIEYPSATDSTRCALQIQKKLKKFNSSSPKIRTNKLFKLLIYKLFNQFVCKYFI